MARRPDLEASLRLTSTTTRPRPRAAARVGGVGKRHAQRVGRRCIIGVTKEGIGAPLDLKTAATPDHSKENLGDSLALGDVRGGVRNRQSKSKMIEWHEFQRTGPEIACRLPKL
jgi:hypothetical protein